MAEYVCEDMGLHAGGGTASVRWHRRERIVRCRDCRMSFEERGELWCRGIVGPPVEPDGFCAWGEEREQ